MYAMSAITIRSVTDEEFPAFVQAFMDGFGNDVPSDDFVEMIQSTLPADRTLAAFDGEAIVGTFAGYDFTLTVPGGSVPMEGTTVVTVFPTHRRMGLMRDMMERHLDTAAEAGYPIAGLWASETSIYDRFGYGVATKLNQVEMRGPNIQFRNSVPKGQVQRVSLDQAKDIVPDIFERLAKKTPGMFRRSVARWTNEVLVDAEWMKRGRSALRVVVHLGGPGHDGYAIYRQKGDHTPDGHADGSIDVEECMAETPEAHASLWAYLTKIDGYPIVKYQAMPLDDPLPLIVTEPRRVHTVRQWDALWVRILDVESALTARSYEHNGSLTFGVVDPFRPATGGVYKLDVVDGVASCSRSTDEPVLEVDIDVLGALYLGGANAISYAAADRVHGDIDVVSELNAMFRTGRQPWCPEIF